MRRTLLILTSRFPYPVIGGDRLRIYYICKELSRFYKLHLLSLCESSLEMEMSIPTDGVFEVVDRIYLPKWKSYLNCFTAIFSNTPLQIAYYKSDKFEDLLKTLILDCDGIFAHLIRTGDYVKNLNLPKFLEMTDAISLNYQRIKSKNITDFRSLIFSFETNRLNKYEKNIVNKFDYSFLVSEVDRQYLYKNCLNSLSKVILATNGVDFNRLMYKFNPSGNKIIFIGNMTSLQNINAVFYFASEILPLIRMRIPSAEFLIVGRIKDADRSRLIDFTGVAFTGEVLDISSVIADGGVGIAPIQIGAGIQNKVLEYMAIGLPVVSTSIGLEGINACNDVDLFVADTPADFSDKVITLLENRVLAEKFALSAFNNVISKLDWGTALAPMLRAIRKQL
jgi:glycosyltransferase involved in cell wall biosynthesis